MPHGPDLPIPVPPGSFEATSSDEENESSSGVDEEEYHPQWETNEPQRFDQRELNDLVREIKLTKDCEELL